MKKTLYSLMLNDEVIREVDMLAHRLGTNRSSLVNEILAEYVNYTTPEKRINDILSAIQEMMLPSEDLVPFFAPHTYSMSLKSSLDYKYRPTIKYEVELFKGIEEHIGILTVLFRTQSPALIDGMTDFFRLWTHIEETHLSPVLGCRIDFKLYDGKFVRGLTQPDKNCTSEELASAIGEYIRLFDRMMKGWLTGQYDAHTIEAAYFSFMRNAEVRF